MRAVSRARAPAREDPGAVAPWVNGWTLDSAYARVRDPHRGQPAVVPGPVLPDLRAVGLLRRPVSRRRHEGVRAGGGLGAPVPGLDPPARARPRAGRAA